MNCRHVSNTQPRVITGRHEADCTDDTCRGCQPCTGPHCRIPKCGTHTQGACPEHTAEVRDNLEEIGRLCDNLPDEVEFKGVHGEAMHLLGPAADPEQWRQRGRYGHRYHADAQLGEDHPSWVIHTWEMLYREALGHDRGWDGIAYFERNLTYLAGYEDLPFEDFAHDIKHCRAHLEAVLHDGEQIITGAPCMACGTELLHRHHGDELPWSTKDKPVRTTEDGWACPRCRRWHTENQYRLSVSHLHREHATHLTDRDMEIRFGISAATVRSWARPTHGRDALISKRREEGRIVYAVAEVEATARSKGMLKGELTA